MKFLIIIVLIFIDPGSITELNQLKKSGLDKMKNQEFDKALETFTILRDSMDISEAQLQLNIANCQYKLGNKEEALRSYQETLAYGRSKETSRALQQMGAINFENKKYQEALSAFRESIIHDPTNEDSRFNYELVKKKLEEQSEQEDQQEDQEDQEKQDQEDKKDQKDQENKQDQKDQEDNGEKENSEERKEQEQDQEEEKEGEQGEEKESEEGEEKEKEEGNKKEADEEEKGKEEPKPQPSKQEPNFDEVKISPEVAKMILQAMENREMQYFQQLKKEATTNKKSKSKW